MERDTSLESEQQSMYTSHKDEQSSEPVSHDDLERSCFKRYFGPVGSGSLRGSIFAMASITFGAGCLAFPYAVSKCGPILSFLIFCICAASSYYTLYILLESGSKAKIMDYNLLLEHTAGKKMVVFSDLNNIVLCVGVIMSYQFTVYKFALQLGEKYTNIDPTNDWNRIILILVCLIVIQLPLSFLKNISTLQYASIVGSIALVYSIIVIVIEMPFYLIKNIKEGIEIPLFKPISLNYLDTFATFMFGFSSHNGIFQVFTELKRPSIVRYYKVLERSFVIELILYIAISFAGYLSTLDLTPDIFLERPDLPGFNDVFIQVAKFTLFVCLHCSMAINYNIMRMSIKTMFFQGRDIPPVKDFLITVFTYSLTNIAVFYISNITEILGVIGGFCTIIICFVNPIIIKLKLSDEPYSSRSNLIAIFIGVFVTLFGTLATINSLFTTIISFF
jgi:amino acid permease